MSVIQQTPVQEHVNIAKAPKSASLPLRPTQGNYVLVACSGYNPQETGRIVESVTDDQGNSYAAVPIFGTAGTHGVAEAYLARVVGTGGTGRVTVTPLVNNNQTRLTWSAIEIGNLISPIALDRYHAAASPVPGTGMTSVLGVTQFTNQWLYTVFAGSWQDSPKNLQNPPGFETVIDHPSNGSTMALQILRRFVVDKEAYSATWGFVNQSQGAQALMFSLRSSDVPPVVRTVLDSDFSGSTQITYEVRAWPDALHKQHGNFLFSGVIPQAPNVLDAAGNLILNITPPSGVTLPGTKGKIILAGYGANGRGWGTGWLDAVFQGGV